MKPQDIQIAPHVKERRVKIEDRIFYVPGEIPESDPFVFPGWSSPELFGNENPVHVEYCSGNGLWIAQKAMENPHLNWVAIEMKYMRVRKIRSKIKNLELKNLVVLCGEALGATTRYFPAGSCAAAYINFPDPWPKRRHAKNRLVQRNFVEQVRRILRPEGTFTLVTDDPPYSKIMIKEMCGNAGFASAFPDPYYVNEIVDYGSSYFEDLWRSKGKLIHFHQFRKVN